MENIGIVMMEMGMVWWWFEWCVKKVYGFIKGLEYFE